MNVVKIAVLGISAFALVGTLTDSFSGFAKTPVSSDRSSYPVTKTDAEWKRILTREQYKILRGKGTETPYINKYDHNKAKGTYYCAACGNTLFSSLTKFDSGTGWPSFFKAASSSSVKNIVDNTYGMSRTEVVCASCGGHLGHVFNDGPKPTGLRYCMNSAAMTFKASR